MAVFLWSCSTSPKKENQRKKMVHFTWPGQTISGKKYNHTAIFVPVRIDTLNNSYKMQLDLGAPYNLFYGGVLSNIVRHYPYLKNKVSKTDSAGYTWFNAPISIGKHHSKIKIRTGGYFSEIGKKDWKNIGEIGVNQFENKILGIDFSKQKMWMQDSLNNEAKTHYSFTDLELRKKRVIIKLMVNNKIVDAMYDTGSSLISIEAFDKNNFNKLRSDSTSTPDSLELGGFGGKKIIIYKDKLNKKIYLNNIQLNTKTDDVFYEKDVKSLAKKTGSSYLVGNKFFSDKTILLDFKEGKFGIKKK
jgi:hypothetical protein